MPRVPAWSRCGGREVPATGSPALRVLRVLPALARATLSLPGWSRDVQGCPGRRLRWGALLLS